MGEIPSGQYSCKNLLRKKEEKSNLSLAVRDSSRLGMVRDRNPDPYACIVQSYLQICNRCLVTVYVSKRMFSSNIFSLEFSLSLISSFSSPPTGKQAMCSWSGKVEWIKAGQSDNQTSWAVKAWEEANRVERKLKVWRLTNQFPQLILATDSLGLNRL